MWRICLWILGFKGSYYKANQNNTRSAFTQKHDVVTHENNMLSFHVWKITISMTTWYKVNCTFCSRKKYWSEIEHYVATLNLKISPLVTCARIVISLVHYPHSRNIFWNTQNEISYLHAALLYPLNISCVSFCFISEWGCPIKCECLPWWWTSMPCGPLLLSHTRQ